MCVWEGGGGEEGKVSPRFGGRRGCWCDDMMMDDFLKVEVWGMGWNSKCG